MKIRLGNICASNYTFSLALGFLLEGNIARESTWCLFYLPQLYLSSRQWSVGLELRVEKNWEE